MITFTDPKSNKNYFIKTILIPLTRLSLDCQDNEHGRCFSSAHLLIRVMNPSNTIAMACLCDCHHDKAVK